MRLRSQRRLPRPVWPWSRPNGFGVLGLDDHRSWMESADSSKELPAEIGPKRALGRIKATVARPASSQPGAPRAAARVVLPFQAFLRRWADRTCDRPSPEKGTFGPKQADHS